MTVFLLAPLAHAQNINQSVTIEDLGFTQRLQAQRPDQVLEDRSDPGAASPGHGLGTGSCLRHVRHIEQAGGQPSSEGQEVPQISGEAQAGQPTDGDPLIRLGSAAASPRPGSRLSAPPGLQTREIGEARNTTSSLVENLFPIPFRLTAVGGEPRLNILT